MFGNGLTLLLMAFMWLSVESRTRMRFKREIESDSVKDSEFIKYPRAQGVFRNAESLSEELPNHHNSTDEDLKRKINSLLIPGAPAGLESSEIFEQSMKERKGDYDIVHIRGEHVGQYLLFLTEKTQWANADKKCRERFHSRLAVLNSPKAFHTYVAKEYPGESFWLGGRRNEGVWTWRNKQSMGNFPWGQGQPDNWNGNEDCLEWGYGNNFNDNDCNIAQRFACDLASYGAEGTFIGGQRLTFHTAKLSWQKAESECKRLNSKLAVLNNPQAVHSYLVSSHSGENFWLGGHTKQTCNDKGYYCQHSGITASECRLWINWIRCPAYCGLCNTWTWVDGHSFRNFPWGPYQPDNFELKENCLEWGFQNNYNDADCSKAKGFICEHVSDGEDGK